MKVIEPPELWKITYENGKQVSKELIHTSTYAMSPTIVVKGTKKASTTIKKDDSDKDDKKSSEEKTKKSTSSKKSKKSE